MMDVIKNGLRQDLRFKGALHLSLKDQKVNGYDKLVINVNTADHGTWVDMIVIYNMLDNSWENFRIGGNIDQSLTGHQDLHKWLDMCVEELDWKGVISSSNKDILIVEIFNFINGVSDVILTSDTEYELKDQDSLGVETFYPWLEEDPINDPEEVEEEITLEGEEDEENFINLKSPSKEEEVHPGEPIQFLDYKLKKIEDGGLGHKSPNFIFSYENDKIYSNLDLFIEKDEKGDPHITKADLYKYGFGGSRDKVRSISTADELLNFSKRTEEFADRIIKAPNLGSATKEAFYKDRILKDLNTLVNSLASGMEWKGSLEDSEED